MTNPIIKAIGQSRIGQIMEIKKMLEGQNPDTLFNMLIQTNPQFRSFVEQNKGKSPEQIAKENGIDINNLFR